MAAGVLILVGFAIMGWSALGLINPVRFAKGSRGRAFGVGVIGFALFMGGGAMLPPTPEPASAVSTPVDSRVHPESAFPESVAVLIAEGALAESVTQARAYHNDLELTLSAAASDVLAAASCDQQRDYVASQWLKRIHGSKLSL